MSPPEEYFTQVVGREGKSPSAEEERILNRQEREQRVVGRQAVRLLEAGWGAVESRQLAQGTRVGCSEPIKDRQKVGIHRLVQMFRIAGSRQYMPAGYKEGRSAEHIATTYILQEKKCWLGRLQAWLPQVLKGHTE